MNDKKAKRPLWLRITINLAILVAVFAAFRTWQMSGVRHEGPLPVFAGTTVQGEAFRSVDLAGRPALVHFWATWCPVCRMELGTIDALARDYQVMTVAFEEASDAKLRKFLDAKGVSFPVIVDRGGVLAKQFGIRGVPTSFFVDAAGNVKTAEMGYTTGLGMRLRLWWAGR